MWTWFAVRFFAVFVLGGRIPNIRASSVVVGYTVRFGTARHRSKHSWIEIYALVSSGVAVSHQVFIGLLHKGSIPGGKAVLSGAPVRDGRLLDTSINLLLIKNDDVVRVQSTSKGDGQFLFCFRTADQGCTGSR